MYAVETLNPFELRKLNPFEFSKQELSLLYKRFRDQLDTFIIYFLPDAIEEKFGYPKHLKAIGEQLLSYQRFNLIVAPRGYSKSTIISCGFPIHEIAYHRKQYIVIVSETLDIAGDFTETIRFELETNERIKLFFGEFKSYKDRGDSTEKWTVDDIVCKSISPETGRPFYTRVRARGAGQQIRGKKHRHQRPDLLIFDDFESKSNTDTEDQRYKNTKWFNRDALKIMDRWDSETGKGQVVVAGTIVHPESRLNRLKINTEQDIINGKIPIWQMQLYQAAENYIDFKNPLWVERFDDIFLKIEEHVARSNDDYAGFLQEFFNIPIDIEERKFKPEYFIKRFNTVQIENYHGTIVMLKDGRKYPCKLSIGLDLGGWKEKESDFTAIVIGANIYDPVNDVYKGFVLDAYNERWNPDQIIDIIFEISNRFSFKDDYGNFTYKIPWTVETNAFQTLLYHFLNKEMQRRLDFAPNIANMRHETANKVGRILSLVPVFRTHFYSFSEHLQWLISMFLNYGLTDGHDDVQDAFEKMHAGLVTPEKKTFDDLEMVMPIYKRGRIVEPPTIFEGNWATL